MPRRRADRPRSLAGSLPFEAWKRHRIDTVVVYFGVLTSELCGAIHGAGLSCWTYGPIDGPDHAQCRAWDLDAVITDFPQHAR